MRVHGELKISRRIEVPLETNYANYRGPLSEDFNNICGYCGKSIYFARKGFEIDHFVPISTDKTRETDYNNLVFSCFTCNRKKAKKWPTKNKDLCHDGYKGFVDPATEEYDSHLGRNKQGAIEHYTDVGKYMYGVFKFQLRPTETVWKSMELFKRKEKLYQLKRDNSKLSIDQMELFVAIQEELDNLLEYLLGKGE
ncbi:HNH endonuclease [Cohnella xylanilytica]|uniref:HNH endonuclease n=1 Tax=Cohnella xylanilytica TaxID=557555 RepID=A0A841U333_9BACL|nr:HNH endonuclease signature motif containing protein [Cohnella xylanilytica]MBB6693558.1 HNH endonuclease [Cohnella xylanilytica]